jgi:hypothetical protein
MTRRLVAPVLAALTLVGCGAPIVYYRYVSTYTPGEYAYAGPLWLDVRGNPYNVTQQQLDTALADDMSGGIWGIPTQFVTTRDPMSRSPYKVVWMFDPPNYATGDFLCGGGKTVQQTSSGGSTKVFAVLCRGDVPISYVYAGFASDGPGDPAFRTAVQYIEVQLLPPRNENFGTAGADGDEIARN